MMKKFVFYFIITGTILVVFSGCTSEVRPPNIVLIMSDDQGFGDFGFTGNEYIETPNLDKLKSQSVYFDRFYVSPVCAPTRASLLTGRYHLRTGTTWVTHGKEVMNSEELTIAESFSENGYATGCFGKWHNGEHYPYNPNGQGFDTFFGFSAGHWNNYFDATLEYNGNFVKTEGYITDVLTDSAMQFIQRNKKRPFFCYVPYNAPHGPFQVEDRYFDKYKAKGLDDKTAAVYGMCENIDDNVGRILQQLDDLKLTNNTIVLYLTDNGPNGVRYNSGMKGIKASVDEGGVRTPLLIRYPGVLRAGDTVFNLAAHIDILPTLHGLTGIPFKEKFPLDGIDLSQALISGSGFPGRSIYTHHVNRTVEPTPASLRSSAHRLVFQDGDTLLFDMSDDPGQTKNIAKEQPAFTYLYSGNLSDWFQDVTSGKPFVPTIPVGYQEAPRVTLPAPEAALSGSLKFKGSFGWANDWIIGFESDKSRATWLLEVVREADYTLYAKMACNAPEKESKLTIKTEDVTLYYAISESFEAPVIELYDRVPRTEVTERDWPLVELGTVHLNEGQKEVSVFFEGDPNTQLEVKEFVLVSAIN